MGTADIEKHRKLLLQSQSAPGLVVVVRKCGTPVAFAVEVEAAPAVAAAVVLGVAAVGFA